MYILLNIIYTKQDSTNCAHIDERVRKEVSACTKLRARKSIKTPLSSAECI